MSHRLAPALLTLALLAAPPASAHDTVARVEQRRVGFYSLEILLVQDPPLVGQPLGIAVRALPDGPPLDGATLTVTGSPGLGTEATPTRAVALAPEPAEPGSWAGELVLPVRGAWDLQVRVDGPAGSGLARVPLIAATSTAIPTWLGWLVGLSPLLGLAWFAHQQRRYLCQAGQSHLKFRAAAASRVGYWRPHSGDQGRRPPVEPAPETSIGRHFAASTDPRVERAKEHRLVDIVTIALCAVLCGADDWVAIRDLRAGQGGPAADLPGAAGRDSLA